MSIRLESSITRAERLMQREIEAREEGRRLELDPAKVEQARAWFARASQARRIRLRLLRRIGI